MVKTIIRQLLARNIAENSSIFVDLGCTTVGWSGMDSGDEEYELILARFNMRDICTMYKR